LQTHDKFGRGGAVSDDGHADDHRRDLEPARERNRAADEIFGSEKEENETGDELNDSQHGPLLWIPADIAASRLPEGPGLGVMG